MVQMNKDIVGLDAAIFMHPTTWKASGHVDAFNDPLIDNKDSKDIVQMYYLRTIFLRFRIKMKKVFQKLENDLGNHLMKKPLQVPIKIF